MNLEDVLKEPNASIEAVGLNLDGVPFENKYEMLGKLLQKITKTGSVTITGMDIYSFAKSVTHGDRSMEESNQIIRDVKSMDSLDNIKRFLLQHNFKTESCKREGGVYVCSARRQ
jgi:hypothetical protein